ncbi:MAG: hypothetical protein LBE85_13260 [Candidatus Accumulibacter sp.]|jgi:hypothetical protein|nr:hypothetical protein [Accumulibacter sp.]
MAEMKPFPESLLVPLPAAAILCLLPGLAWAQVSLPNGGVGEVVVDLKVQMVSGLITVDRQYEDDRWQIHWRWNPLELKGGAIAEATGGEACPAWREVKIQGRSYAGSDGLSWKLENRYSTL